MLLITLFFCICSFLPAFSDIVSANKEGYKWENLTGHQYILDMGGEIIKKGDSFIRKDKYSYRFKKITSISNGHYILDVLASVNVEYFRKNIPSINGEVSFTIEVDKFGNIVRLINRSKKENDIYDSTINTFISVILVVMPENDAYYWKNSINKNLSDYYDERYSKSIWKCFENKSLNQVIFSSEIVEGVNDEMFLSSNNNFYLRSALYIFDKKNRLITSGCIKSKMNGSLFSSKSKGVLTLLPSQGS